MNWLLFFISFLALLVGLASRAEGQIPETFTNLQVLPKDIDRRILIETMRSFSFALGVRCEHCHLGGPMLDQVDFASDEREAKGIARRMLRMVEAINREHISPIRGGETTVQCFTCHRGVARPVTIESIMETVLDADGAEAAIARYRELRNDHYGRGSYDFGDIPLNRLGESLLGAGKAGEAISILELNAEFHADSAWVHQLLGEAYLASGDREKARASFEKSLTIAPENSAAKKRLEELEK